MGPMVLPMLVDSWNQMNLRTGDQILIGLSLAWEKLTCVSLSCYLLIYLLINFMYVYTNVCGDQWTACGSWPSSSLHGSSPLGGKSLYLLSHLAACVLSLFIIIRECTATGVISLLRG